MIWGIIKRNPEQSVLTDSINKMAAFSDGKAGSTNIYIESEVGFGCQALPMASNAQAQPITNSDKSISVVFQGQIYNAKELASLCNSKHENVPASLILDLYKKTGLDFVNKINGKFVFTIYDKKQHKIVMARDRFGIEPLFYYLDSDQLVFGTNLHSIVNNPEIDKELDYRAMYQFLLFCYNPALYTFFKNVKKLRPGHLLIIENNNEQIKPYWNLSFANPTETDEQKVCDELLNLMKDATKIRHTENMSKGVFLSGGMDSSTIVALSNEVAKGGLSTYSFRCKGETFDESHYAKIVADHYKTDHHLVEYASEDVELIDDIVKLMDEPFCDLGINIASYILGREAGGAVQNIFTGDGGDELYGGHPVYEADIMSQKIEKIPSFLLKPVFGIASHLPDSDKKKNFVVKAKRYSYSVNFPKELFSHRWRIYYNKSEMQQLVSDDFWQEIKDYDPYEEIYNFNREADGKDILSKSLYSDYQTVVGFYLRRMSLLRHFGLDTRFPLLDHRLVEYTTKIPSEMKIKNNSDTKYIFKKSMEKVLPHDIVYRKDKLGHSIPLKNWMRDNKRVKSFVSDLLSESTIKQRGMFNFAYIDKLMSQHQSKRANFSHRLWTLAVLELWLKNKTGK